MKAKFTQAEVEELVASVKKNPGNLAKVFRELSEKWETHSANSISMYYYRNIRRSQPLFLTVGEKKVFINRKIVLENANLDLIRVCNNVWSRIKRLFRL